MGDEEESEDDERRERDLSGPRVIALPECATAEVTVDEEEAEAHER